MFDIFSLVISSCEYFTKNSLINEYAIFLSFANISSLSKFGCKSYQNHKTEIVHTSNHEIAKCCGYTYVFGSVVGGHPFESVF